MTKLGLIHVYTGDGKGKTTASLGLALRAIGNNFKVYIIQFMKGGGYTGEIVAFNTFFNNIDIHQFGKGCIKESKQLNIFSFAAKKPEGGHFVRGDEACGTCRYCFVNDDEQKEYCLDAYNHAKRILKSNKYDIVILDELNCAVFYNMMPLEKALELVNCKGENTELVITGRGAPQEIIDKADLVTEMKQVKHYFDKGVMARRGIEY